ncbi:hypothetical protein [Bartonella sp. B1098]|uniref:hypothetical protein n=1 Tax=Bartonella sp. B1098 TaxID=2911421 RepID=UPI0020C35A7E|nr:hypothetical protein [Bartonella sp. B1098]
MVVGIGVAGIGAWYWKVLAGDFAGPAGSGSGFAMMGGIIFLDGLATYSCIFMQFYVLRVSF